MPHSVQNVLKLRWGMLASRETAAIRGIELLGKASVQWAEIPGEYLVDAGDLDLAELLSLCRARQVQIWSVRMPFRGHDDIADPDEANRRRTVQLYGELIRKTSVLGCRTAVLTPSHQKSEEIHPDDIVSSVCRSLDELLPLAERYGVRLALKNLLPPYFGCLPAHFEMILGLYDSPHLGCCFDTGHAHLTNCFEEMLNAMWPRMLNLHLHDNMADRDWHFQPGYGNAPFELLFARMQRDGWDSPAIVEARPWGQFDGNRMFLELDALVNSLVGGSEDYPRLFAPGGMLGLDWPTDWIGRTIMRCPLSGHFVVFHQNRASTPAREWEFEADNADSRSGVFLRKS